MTKLHHRLHRRRLLLQSIQTMSLPQANQPLNRQRRFLLLMGSAAFLSSACSGKMQTNNQPASPTSETVKRMQHAFGETEIPINPARIVVLGVFIVEAVVALGIQPIGLSVDVFNFFTHLSPSAHGVTDIGHPREPNLEQILVLKPDLILTTKSYSQSDTYNLLSTIAPTVVFDAEGKEQWQHLTYLCAEVLGKQTQAERLAADYNTKLQTFKTELSKDPRQVKVSVAYLYPGRLGIYGKDTFSGSVLEAAGLSRPHSQTQGQGTQISLELLSEMDGDVLFLLSPQNHVEVADEIQSPLAQLKENPLWSQLKAVQTNQVYEVDTHWYGSSYIAANLILDDLLKYVAI